MEIYSSLLKNTDLTFNWSSQIKSNFTIDVLLSISTEKKNGQTPFSSCYWQGETMSTETVQLCWRNTTYPHFGTQNTPLIKCILCWCSYMPIKTIYWRCSNAERCLVEENVKAYRLPAESELESLSQRAVAPMQRSGVLTNRNSFQPFNKGYL